MRRATLHFRLVFAVVTLIASGQAVLARDDLSFAIIFGAAKNDGGFNEAAVRAVERLKAEHGIPVRERLSNDADELEPILRQMMARGATDVLTLSFASAAAMRAVAPDFPAIRFTVIDAVVDAPNVRSVVFREEEAGFLVGAAAGFATRTGRVGFLGALAIPPIRRFGCGFVQGVAAAAPQATVDWRYIGDGLGAFRDSRRASTIAAAIIADGADILFQAAGPAGVAAMGATVTAGGRAIGVDVNQNGMFPGEVLTSALKEVETAVHASWSSALDGTWAAGVVTLGLAENGVAWAVDADNEALVAPFRHLVDGFAAEIRTGARRIEGYEERPDCPGG